MSGDDERPRRLLDVGTALVAELDPEAVLERILEEAREITGARYAALGVLGEDRSELPRRSEALQRSPARLRCLGLPPRTWP
jgi:GAF domain-containing protein